MVVVVVRCIPNCLQSTSHTAEVNWTPLSIVMAASTLNLEIQLATRASAHAVAVVEVRGTISTHLVLLSIIVRHVYCVWPSALVVRGPTRSTCRWGKLRSGMGMGWTGAVGCFCNLSFLACCTLPAPAANVSGHASPYESRGQEAVGSSDARVC